MVAPIDAVREVRGVVDLVGANRPMADPHGGSDLPSLLELPGRERRRNRGDGHGPVAERGRGGRSHERRIRPPRVGHHDARDRDEPGTQRLDLPRGGSLPAGHNCARVPHGHPGEHCPATATQPEKGLSLIPTKFYLKKGKIKCELALAKGKKLHDKRDAIRDRDLKRDADREMRNR